SYLSQEASEKISSHKILKRTLSEETFIEEGMQGTFERTLSEETLVEELNGENYQSEVVPKKRALDDSDSQSEEIFKATKCNNNDSPRCFSAPKLTMLMVLGEKGSESSGLRKQLQKQQERLYYSKADSRAE
ncbi:27927_t:CDS:2, partial [Dentiscutata erythropus]